MPVQVNFAISQSALSIALIMYSHNLITILMSSKLSRVVLVAGLLVGGLSFSSCSQDGSPQMETADSVNYSRVAISLGDVETTAQPMEESSARALSFELDNSKQQFPKVKGLTDGTEVLCIIRSSTPQQPVNYIKAKLIKKTGTTKPTYRLTFDGTVSRSSTPAPSPSETNFAYDKRYSLGTLSMMIVTGGEWDETTKHLNVSPKLVRADVDAAAMEYDMPYVSEWRPLKYTFKQGESNPSSLRLTLKDYDFDLQPESSREHYTMKPVGMLLRMPVEEEMSEDGGGNYQLNGITLRTTAFGGQGYFNFSQSNIKAIQTDVINQKERSYRHLWIFSDPAESDEAYRVVNPTEHSYDGTGAVEYGTRLLRKFKPRYYLFLWTMPRNQQPDDVTNGNVRTQIYADVDVKTLDGTKTVYSNSSDADQKELQGYAVVPRMKALPVYASDRLVVKNNADAAFVEGTSYRLTLNLNRPDLPLEMLSQYPVNKNYTGFTDDKEEAAYIVNEQQASIAQLAAIDKAFGTVGQGNWSVPSFKRISMIFGAINSKGTLEASTAFPNPVDHRVTPYLNTQPYADAGTYSANRLKDGSYNDIRMLLGLASVKKADGTVVVYSLIFYPSMASNGVAKQRRGDRLSILRAEYTTNTFGQPVFRMTQRYIGAYSNDVGILSPNMPVQDDNATKPLVVAALQKIIDKGDAYWNDNLRKQDDIVRELPLWMKNRTTNVISQSGDAAYTLDKMAYLVFNQPKPATVFFGNLGMSYPADSYGGYSRTSDIPYLPQAPVLMMRDRLTRK